MNIKIVTTFSIFIAVVISIFLGFSIFGILYFYWGDVSAVKDSLSTVGSFFGGFTTLGAAIVAAYLFNDWKIQHNKQVVNNFGFQVYEQFSNLEKDMSIYHQYLDQLEELIDSYDYEVNAATMYGDNNLNYISNITKKMGELKISFYNLYSKFQAYSLVLGTLDVDSVRYNRYLDSFNDINAFDDDLFVIKENLKTWYENYNETMVLMNEIRQFDIQNLLVSLKAD